MVKNFSETHTLKRNHLLFTLILSIVLKNFVYFTRNFSIPPISEDMIYTKLKTISEDMTFGPDSVPLTILLKSTRVFSTPRPYLFN